MPLSFRLKIKDFAHEHSSLNYITNSINISNRIQNLFNIIISKSIKTYIEESNRIAVGENSVRPNNRAISREIEHVTNKL